MQTRGNSPMDNLIIIPDPSNYLDSEKAMARGYLSEQDLNDITTGISMDLAFNKNVESVTPKYIVHNLKNVEGLGIVDSYMYFIDIVKSNKETQPLRVDINFVRPNTRGDSYDE